MVKETAILCDICKEHKAHTKCFLCEIDICENHNFGGDQSQIIINAFVYNNSVFDIQEEDTLVDCCPNCTDRLTDIMNRKKDILEKRLKEDVEEIKSWLLKEISEPISKE